MLFALAREQSSERQMNGRSHPPPASAPPRGEEGKYEQSFGRPGAEGDREAAGFSKSVYFFLRDSTTGVEIPTHKYTELLLKSPEEVPWHRRPRLVRRTQADAPRSVPGQISGVAGVL